MATGSDQLIADYEQLQSTLELYPSIQIILADGQPPDHYELEYQIRGYVKAADGSVEIGEIHRVAINLPFGYPHFAPTVKPLTNIFHPDIDPAAVRIAEQWEAKPSLADIALHIGEMICGNVYNAEDPFNQEAADWYVSHRDELPLDVLKIADIEDSDERFDTLDDDTFASLGLEDDDLLGPDHSEGDGQAELLASYLEEKKFYAASGLLHEIPPSVAIPDREEIEQKIAIALREADRLHTEAEQLENQGRLEEAAAIVDTLQETAADSPGLEELRSRIKKSRSLSGSLSEELTEQPEKKEKKSAATKTGPRPPAAAGRKTRPSLPSVPMGLILTVILLVAVIGGGGGSLYFKDKNAVDQARADWKRTEQLVGQRQFVRAEETANAALNRLQSVLILRAEKNELAGQINTLLGSQDFQEGLAGRILYKGEYISEDQARTLRQLSDLIDKAEQLVKNGRISRSITAYQEALRFAMKNGLDTRAQTLRQTINNLRFEQTMANAKQAEQDKEWESAAETYRKALQLSKILGDQQETGEISKRLTAATFRHELDQSRAAFTASQWQQTIDMLEHAQQLIDADPDAVSEQEKKQLARLLASSRLYQMLAIARQAYEQRDWNKASDEYTRALDLLREKEAILGSALGNSITKIEKTLLMVKIAREQSNALAAKRKNDLTGAIAHYRKILQLAAGSRFRQDKALQSITANIQDQITSTTAQLNIQRKVGWLTEHFSEIFRKSYPSFAGSELEHPTVTYIKKQGQKMIFKMTCTERSRGRSSRLELNYQYNPASGKWSLYTGK